MDTVGTRTAATVIPATQVGSGPDGRRIFRPIVIVSIEIGDRTIKGAAMVDSGADNTLVPAEALAGAGIDFETLPDSAIGTGVGGPLKTRVCRGTIRYEDWPICEAFTVAEPGKLDVILLGRSDFFSKFETTFRWDRDPPEFELLPVARD